MTGKKARSDPKAEVEQAAPTAARPVDANGRELDQFGLPLNGPARAAALAELGLPDPNDAPEAWTSADTAEPRATAATASVVASGKVSAEETGNG